VTRQRFVRRDVVDFPLPFSVNVFLTNWAALFCRLKWAHGEGKMKVVKYLATGLMVLTVMAVPAVAQSSSSAEKVRRLDMMLMVTSLRCRTTPENFQADYRSFTARQYAHLQKANADLRRQYAAQKGGQGANRELDRISTDMANRYGLGHPWMDCAQLGKATRELAAGTGEAPLVAAADRLLGSSPPATLSPTLAAAVP
jgi:hypothetical protein